MGPQAGPHSAPGTPRRLDPGRRVPDRLGRLPVALGGHRETRSEDAPGAAPAAAEAAGEVRA